MDIDEKNLADTVLSEKIYRIFKYIEDTIKENGDISQFKEDVLYVIHFLLERQLEPRQLTATEITVKQREYLLFKEQRKKDEEHIRLLKCELDKKDKIINEMGTTMAAICTGLATVREQFEKCYCEFINSDEDCCWKTDKSCKNCIIEYITKKVEGK